MVMSDFRPEVKIWPFRACAMKNMQYNRYYRNSSVTIWTWLLGRYHVPQNVFLVVYNSVFVVRVLLELNSSDSTSTFYLSHQLALPLVIL